MNKNQYILALLVLSVASFMGGAALSWLLDSEAAFAEEPIAARRARTIQTTKLEIRDASGKLRASLDPNGLQFYDNQGAVTWKAPSQTSLNAKAKVQFAYLRQFKHGKVQNGFGADVLLKDDLSERELIALVKQLAGSHDPVLIRIFTSRLAYNQERNNKYGPEYNSDYILFYVKNFSSLPAYRGSNEIRWMQETGKFSSKFGTKTKF